MGFVDNRPDYRAAVMGSTTEISTLVKNYNRDFKICLAYEAVKRVKLRL